MNELISGLLGFIGGVHPILRIILAGVAMFFETSILLGVIIPGDTVMLFSATATGNWAEYFGLVAAGIIGALLGESAGFAIGRWAGPKLQRSRLGRKLGEENWVRAQTFLEQRGGPAVFISRFLPVLHSLIPVTAGMSTMKYRVFMAWTSAASTIWAVAYVSVGWTLGSKFKELSGELKWAGFLFVAIVILFFIIVALVKKRLSKIVANAENEKIDPQLPTQDPQLPKSRSK